MTNYMRKKDTGEQGNGGQFGSTRRSEADVEMPVAGAPPHPLTDLDGLQDDVHFARRVTGRWDADSTSGYYPAMDRIFDATEAFIAHSRGAEQPYAEAATPVHASRQAAVDAIREYADATRSSHETDAQSCTRAARELHREAAADEAREAIDGLRELGARNGAAFVSFPGHDDPDDPTLLSAYPVFHDAAGEERAWSEDPAIQNDDAYTAWLISDRSWEVVEDLSASFEGDPELDELSTRTDRVFVYRCTTTPQD